MHITDERLRELQEAYREDFGEDISPADARAMLHRLIAFYELVLSPLPANRMETGAEGE